jgi:hypothetical protein
MSTSPETGAIKLWRAKDDLRQLARRMARLQQRGAPIPPEVAERVAAARADIAQLKRGDYVAPIETTPESTP